MHARFHPRRPSTRRRSGRWWVLGIIAGLAIAGAVGIWQVAGGSGRSLASSGVGCSRMEQLGYHAHAALTLFVDGQPVAVPASVGIGTDCVRWLHTHDAGGVVHVEAPAFHGYTLGQFFQVWGQRLDATHLLDRVSDDQHSIRVYYNREPYQGAPQTVTLDPHAVIVVEYGPPFVPPPTFTFPPGL